MSDLLNIGGTNATPSGAASARAATSQAPKVEAPASTSPGPTPNHISPSVRQDPLSGILITEYFNGDGEVALQLPSAASVAYLRVGLTATGEPKPKQKADEIL